jgi:hypothetical protein
LPQILVPSRALTASSASRSSSNSTKAKPENKTRNLLETAIRVVIMTEHFLCCVIVGSSYVIEKKI